MSSEKADSSFNPQSNAFKSILKKPKEEKKSFGKEEFLARRRYFLEKLENEGGIPKPKPFVSKSPAAAKKKASNEKIRTNINKTVNPTSSIKNTPSNVNSTPKNVGKENVNLPAHEWSISSAKSESLRKIIDLASKKETNTVGKNVFSARQKFFADSQLSSVDQLMPRPATPPGYCYYERCSSPSFDTSTRRNSYGLYSTSPALSSSPIISPSPAPASPSTTCSLPWEHSNKKKEIVQPKPQTKVNVIESLENLPLVSEETIKLPEPVTFKKEILSTDEPITIQTENVEALKPMIAKILESLPEPIQFNTETLPDDESMSVNIINVENIKPQFPKHIFIQESLPEPVEFEKKSLPNDEPMEIITEFISMPEINIPKVIQILPEPVDFTREPLPQDELLNIKTDTVVYGEMKIPQVITVLPEPVNVTNELLPQDEPLEVKTEIMIAEEKQIPETVKMVIEEKFEKRNDLKKDLFKTMDISSLALESNIEEKKEFKKVNNDGLFNDYYSSETQPLIDNDNEVTETKIETINEKQPLLDFTEEVIISNENKPLHIFDTENESNDITENTLISSNNEDVKSSNSSISEYLNNHGTLSLDEPLPRKAIPIYPSNDEVHDLIDLSENDISDKVKNWYNVVDNAINEDDNLEEKI